MFGISRWRYFRQYLKLFSKKENYFNVNATIYLQGITRDKPRWQKCVEYVNDRMGMALGAMFIKDNFDEESKETVRKDIIYT